MKVERYIVFLLAAVLIGCQREPSVTPDVQRCTPMPDGGRASACACALDGKGYVFGGRDSKGEYLNDLWVYDPSHDSWTDLGPTPLTARVNATMAGHESKLYMGLGYSAKKAYQDSAYLQDWWEYTPATGTWKRLTDYPNTYTIAATSFAWEDGVFALYAFWQGFSQYVCRYDIPSDTWSVWPDNHDRALSNAGGRGAWHKGWFYFGGGYNTHNLNQWYAVDITRDEWVRRASIPGKGREFGACAAGMDHVYLFGGRHFGGDMTGGEVFDSYLRYSPDKDGWEWCGTMPFGRAENLIAFSIDGRVYFGLGENEKGETIAEVWRVEN